MIISPFRHAIAPFLRILGVNLTGGSYRLLPFAVASGACVALFCRQPFQNVTLRSLCTNEQDSRHGLWAVSRRRGESLRRSDAGFGSAARAFQTARHLPGGAHFTGCL